MGPWPGLPQAPPFQPYIHAGDEIGDNGDDGGDDGGNGNGVDDAFRAGKKQDGPLGRT